MKKKIFALILAVASSFVSYSQDTVFINKNDTLIVFPNKNGVQINLRCNNGKRAMITYSTDRFEEIYQFMTGFLEKCVEWDKIAVENNVESIRKDYDKMPRLTTIPMLDIYGSGLTASFIREKGETTPLIHGYGDGESIYIRFSSIDSLRDFISNITPTKLMDNYNSFMKKESLFR